MTKQPSSLDQLVIIVMIVSMLVGCGSSTPGLEAVDYTSLPEGLSREEQVAYLMQECIVHTGGQPVHSFVLYAENKPEGIVIHRGVGTVGNSDTPIDREYQFKVASSTKPVVATIILQLMEEGKLNLDDPASKYLEDIAYLRFDELHVLDGESYSDIFRIYVVSQTFSKENLEN